MRYQWLSFTTDYGLADGFVAACRGVIAGIAPQAGVIDVTHAVPPGDIRRGAFVLAQTAPYLPPAVHLAVVDPGVGTQRRGVAVVAEHGVLVGPDNGLLLPAAAALGGAQTAYALSAGEYHRPEVSRTFHGRDVFAPVAAHLATGVPPAALGPAVDLTELVRVPEPSVRIASGHVAAEVATADHFGNLQLAVTAADLAAAGLLHGGPVSVTVGQRAAEPVPVAGTFGDVPPGDPLLFEDSAGLVALAVNGGSAADRYAAGPGAPVVLERPPIE